MFSSLTLYLAEELAARQIKTVTVDSAERSDVVDQVAVVGALVAKEEIRVNALVQVKEVRQIHVEVAAVTERKTSIYRAAYPKPATYWSVSRPPAI